MTAADAMGLALEWLRAAEVWLSRGHRDEADRCMGEALRVLRDAR